MSSLNLITLPIGNKDDITLRALKALSEFKIFYAEDTRVFKDTLKAYGINFFDIEIDSFHDHSADKVDRIIARILNGDKIAIVSDAGSPVISDPAFPLIKKAISSNIKIETYPGVTAVVTALELSGLPSNPFHFWGFLGRSDGDKKKFFHELKGIEGTHIFFESPHRVFETIEIFCNIFEKTDLVIARELTKKFEEVVRINKQNVKEVRSLVNDKGEFVLLFHVEESNNEKISDDLKKEINDFIDNGGNTKKLAKIFAKILNQDTKEIYSRINNSKQNE